jgi:hypothetical protein
MGENICKHLAHKGLVSQMHKEITQLGGKQNDTRDLNMKQRTWAFVPRKRMSAQQVYEKVLTITNHQRSESQNHNESW